MNVALTERIMGIACHLLNKADQYGRNRKPITSSPDKVFPGVLNLRLSCETPGRAADYMMVIRSYVEIPPTKNADPTMKLLDRPFIFTSTDSVLSDLFSFFSRDTFHIPPEL